MNTPVVVVGSYVQDLTFFTPQFPAPGETVIGEFKTGPGGKGSNQAIASVRAGVGTCFIGAVGADAFANVAKDFHKSEGVDARWLLTDEASTGAASIVVNENAQNEIVVALGACNELKTEVVQDKMPDEAQVVVTQLETHLEGSLTAMKLGKEMGALTVLNPAPMRDDFPASILENVDVFIPNETEFVRVLQITHPNSHGDFSEEELLNLSEKALHEKCRLLDVEKVIVTLGARGAFLSEANRYKAFPPLKGIEVVDTTGAGDAFVGGFAAGWVKFDQDIEKAIQHGVVVSGLSVTKLGTAPAMPKAEEIQTLMR